MIKKNEYKQVLILGLINHKEKISADEIKRKLSITTGTFNRYIRSINDDLEELSPEFEVKIINTNDDLSLKNNHCFSPDHLFNLLVDKYLLESNTYRTLKTLLLRNSHNTMLLIEELNVSQSYFNKIIRGLNEFLAPTDVKIIQRNKMIFFNGEEAKIIYLEYLMRHYFETIETLPCICTHKFPNLIDLVRDHNLSDLNDVQLKRMKTLHHTFKKRHTELKKITIENNDIRDILAVIVSKNDLLDDHVDVDDFNYDLRLYSNLLARITSSKLESQDTKTAIGTRLYSLKNPIIKDVIQFVNTISYQFIPNMEVGSAEYAEFIYIISLHVAYIQLFGFNYKSLFQMKFLSNLEENHLDQPVYANLIEYFKQPKNFDYLSPSCQDIILKHNAIFIDSCYTAIRNYRKTSVKISLDFIYRLSFEHFLEKRLRDMFCDTMLVYVKDSSKADILVSDHFVSVPKETLLFTFIDTNSSEALDKLGSLISSTYNQKIMNCELNQS